MCRYFGITTTRFLFTLLRAHLPPIATSLLVAWLVTRLPLSGLLPVAGAMAVVAGSYVAVFAATGLTGGERRELLSRLRTARPAAASPSP
jgi:hypothetical protein